LALSSNHGERPAAGDIMAHRDTLVPEGNHTIRDQSMQRGEDAVSKRGRKKRDRKKNAANHGKRPNT
jgi:hypothetical protein